MRNYVSPLLFLCGMIACSTLGFEDKGVYVLDPALSNLRGHDPAGKDDKPLADCNATPGPDGKLQYKCVAHFLADYQALLVEIDSLQQQLSACQASKGGG